MEYVNSDAGFSPGIVQEERWPRTEVTLPNLPLFKTQLFPSFFAHFLLALQNLQVTGLKTQVDFDIVIEIFLRERVVMVDKEPISENYPQFSSIETNGNNSGSI